MGETEKATFPLLSKIINAATASIIGVACLFPLDLVKTRLQSQVAKPNSEQLYSSMWDCFKKTYKSEGFHGLYHGSAVNMLFVTPEKIIKLVVNDYCRHYFSGEGKLPLKFEIVSGSTAGACQVIVTTPMELLKVQLQSLGLLATVGKVDKETVSKVSARHIAMELLRKEGITGLYKGFRITLLRDVFFSMVYFPLFANLHDLGPKRRDDSETAVFWYTFLAGCASGSVAGLCGTPFDVIKTRLQLLKTVDSEIKYSGILDAAIKILSIEGPLAFFKGGATRMIVMAPTFGIMQTVYYFGVGEYIVNMRQ